MVTVQTLVAALQNAGAGTAQVEVMVSVQALGQRVQLHWDPYNMLYIPCYLRASKGLEVPFDFDSEGNDYVVEYLMPDDCMGLQCATAAAQLVADHCAAVGLNAQHITTEKAIVK